MANLKWLNEPGKANNAINDGAVRSEDCQKRFSERHFIFNEQYTQGDPILTV